MSTADSTLTPTPSFEMKSQNTSPSDHNDCFDIEPLFGRLSDADTDEERREWRRHIIVGCLPLADRVAHRFVGRGEPSDDLTQVARIGLIKSIDRYDPTKGRFPSYAFATILGEVRRHFRDNAWAVHVPRGIKDTHRRVRAAIDPLSQRLGRAPTVSELAAELDVEREAISISMEAGHAYHPASLDAEASASGSADHGVGSRHGADDPRYNAVEDTVTLVRLIAKLPDRQQVVVKMRFYDCLTQSQIAQHFDISQVQVHRLLAAALERLRAQLSDNPDGSKAVHSSRVSTGDLRVEHPTFEAAG